MDAPDDPIQEWRVPRPTLLFHAAAGILLAGMLAMMAFQADTPNKANILGILGAILLIGLAYNWSEWFARIQIDAACVRQVGLFGTREMKVVEVVAVRFVPTGGLVLFGQGRRLNVWRFALLRHSDRVELVRSLRATTGPWDNAIAFEQIYKPLSCARNRVRRLAITVLLLCGLSVAAYSLFEWGGDPLRLVQGLWVGVGMTLVSVGTYYFPMYPLVEAAETAA